MRFALVACLVLATPLRAEVSKAAAWLITEETEAACGAEGGTFAEGSVIERDLTGDGKSDMILSHGGVSCAGDQVQSDYCGAMMCSVMIYVRKDDLLVLVAEFLSAGGDFAFGEGSPPAIRLINHDGSEGEVYWNGTTFR
jgi:hypothetical protein